MFYGDLPLKITPLLSYLSQAVRQTVRIVGMDHPQGLLRTGDRATVTFEFISHPEFIKEGMKLLFREGKTKVCRCQVSVRHF
jgi:GTPase